MFSIFIMSWAIACSIVGLVVIIWPGQITRKLSQEPRYAIRVYGLMVFCTGIWLGATIWVFNWALKLLNSLGK